MHVSQYNSQFGDFIFLLLLIAEPVWTNCEVISYVMTDIHMAST